MKKLAIFDIDGVVYDGHTIFDQIQDQEKVGIIPSGTWDKIFSELSEYKSGAKTYKQAADSMLEIYAQVLKGQNYKKIVEETTIFFRNNQDKFFSYFAKVVPELSKDYDIYFVTTNFQFTCDALGSIFGIKNYLSSVAEVKDTKFTGKVTLSLGGNKGLVSSLISKYGRGGSFAVGDSENDIDMLGKVEHPLVMEPNEKMMKVCEEGGWQIANRDNIQGKLLSLV